MLTTAETALYQQAETLLHRLDPRLKIFACLILVILSFAASGWTQLLAVCMVVVATVCASRAAAHRILSLFWLLRWLLLFTLLLHLFLSPGRTLFGLSWLSFDGLLMGFFVCLQMLQAVAASALLGITTTTVSLSQAFGWYLRPLQWLGCRTDEWQKILLLALDFVPAVHAEILAVGTSEGEAVSGPPDQSGQGRLAAWANKIHGLIFRLVDRGDELAHRLVDDASTTPPAALPSFLPLALLDQLFALLLALVILSYLLIG